MGAMFLQVFISWAPAAAWALALYVLSAQSQLPRGPAFPFADKVFHMGAYLILGTTLAWAGRRSKRTQVHLALISVGVLFAISDEWHQSFIPNRVPSAGDLLADVMGLLVGYSLARRLFAFSHRRIAKGD